MPAYNRCNEFLYCRQTDHRSVILWIFSILVFFGIRNVTPAVNHSGIWSSSINLLKSAAICLCVAVRCLSQKFVIWSLPGAFQFSVVLGASSAMSFSHIGLHSILWFCWYWFLIQCISPLCWNSIPYISLQKFSTSSLSSAFFTLEYVCLRWL